MWAVLVLFFSLFVHPAMAGSFEVAPTAITLDHNNMAVFYITNRSDEPVMAQTEAYLWSQQDGDQKDRLDKSNEIIISPPIIRLQPNQKQTIRFMVRPDATIKSERAFRLMISEIPDPNTAAAADKVRMLLQFSIPVFVSEENLAPPKLVWTAKKSSEGMSVDVCNQGQRHAKISNIVFETADGSFPIDGGKYRYILPNTCPQWPLSGAADGHFLHIKAFDEVANLPVDKTLTIQ